MGLPKTFEELTEVVLAGITPFDMYKLKEAVDKNFRKNDKEDFETKYFEMYRGVLERFAPYTHAYSPEFYFPCRTVGDVINKMLQTKLT